MRTLLFLFICVLCLTCSNTSKLPSHTKNQIWKEVQLFTDSIGTACLLVYQNGILQFGVGDSISNFRAHSMRKSFMSLLYGIYVDSGIVDTTLTLKALNIDDTNPSLNEEEKSARIIDLLKAKSGVYHPAASEIASMKKGRPGRGSHRPGTFWYYNNWDFNVLGVLFEQITQKKIFETFEQEIAQPVGMKDFDSENCFYKLESEHSIHPSYKFRISARDLAKIGQLILNQGKWNNQQIVSKKWLQQSTFPHSITGSKGTKSAYGYMWWISPNGIITASGTKGQRLSIFREKNLVVVHLMNTDIKGGPRIGTSTYDRLLKLVLSKVEG